MNAVEVRGLRKTYAEHVAVQGIDLHIAQGEIFALLGPNGAGKTTTVEILEGHRRRSGGTATVLGEDPGTAGRAWRARIGVMLQTATDAAELTVSESVRHFAGYYPNPRDPEELIERVGLTEKAGSRVRLLSGGQRRRLDVALAMIGRPELVFLDEPTTGFDPEVRRQFWSLVRDLASGGTTVLLTTHYLDEAEALADRVAVIADGRILAEGSPGTLGGRDDASATVRWTDAAGPHAEVTATPTLLIAQLAGRHGERGELDGLTVHRPTLEDVYLELIGSKP